MLQPLLPQLERGPAATKEDWEQRRAELLHLWQEFLQTSQLTGASGRSYSEVRNTKTPVAGVSPLKMTDQAPLSAAPSFEVLDSEDVAGVTRQRIRYETEPGWSVEAFLMKPIAATGRLPGVMVFHSTVPQTIRQPAGIEGEPEKAFGLELARRGYVTLCPRCFLWQSRFERFFQWHARRQMWKLHRRHPRSKGITKMVHDARVGLDVLSSLAEVDPDRIGAVGHSLGGKQVLYLAALDERIRVAASSEGGIGRTFSNWSAPWYLGAAGSTREHHELLGLIAPRAFLLIGGESADGDHSWPFVEEALAVYRLYDPSAKIGLYNHRQGHTVPPEAAERIYEWFNAYL